MGLPWRNFSSFTISANSAWEQDVLQLRFVKVRQEVSDYERASQIGMGSVVWDAALDFVDLVGAAADRGDDFWRGKAVLELGAGCGAAGLTLASLGAEVVLTDRRSVMPLQEQSIALNPALPVTSRLLRWEDAVASDFSVGTPQRPCDVILGTDLVEIDPDRAPGQGLFEALAGAVAVGFEASPDCLIMLCLEERGPLKVEALGELFLPLLERDLVAFEFSRVVTKRGAPRVRHICLVGRRLVETGLLFAEWKRALASEGSFIHLEKERFKILC